MPLSLALGSLISRKIKDSQTHNDQVYDHETPLQSLVDWCFVFSIVTSLIFFFTACGPQAELVQMVASTQKELTECRTKHDEYVKHEHELDEQINDLKIKLQMNQLALKAASQRLSEREISASSASKGNLQLIHQLSRDQLASLATSVGAGVTLRDQVHILAEFGDLKSSLRYSPKNHVLSGYARFTGFNINLDQINQWNMTRRFSRVYLDSSGSAVLEAELDLELGVSVQTLQGWIKNFGLVINLFHFTLRQQGSSPHHKKDQSQSSGREKI